MRTVYADIVLLVNFSLDLVLLYLCCYIYKLRVARIRMLLSALLGAVFSLGIVIFNVSYIFSLILGICTSFMMIFILVGKRNKLVYFRLMLTLYIISFLMSSAVEMILNVYISYTLRKGGVPLWILFTGAGMIMLCSMLFARFFCNSVNKKSFCVSITTETVQKEYTLLCDSGNLLLDPYSNLPVIVLRKDAENELCINDDIYNSYVENHIRYIPVNTAFGRGVLKAIKPKGVRVKNEKSAYKNVDVIIAFSSNEENDFGGNDGIIPQSVVELIN